MKKTDSIFVAGHRGLAGSAIVRELHAQGYANVITHTRAEVDLADRAAVRGFFDAARPAVVVMAAAKVGGIKANNDFPVEFLLENLKVQNNVIEGAADFGVAKLLFLGSSCIYPKFAPQPIREDSLLTGALEQTNEAYALAKIAGIKLCQAYARQYGRNFISAMPTNLYGPGDNFDLQGGHVIPALMRKAHEAKLSRAPAYELWGSGKPKREFLHVDDLADALIHILKYYSGPVPLNIGTGEEVSIAELARTIADVVGFTGTLNFDTSKPDGSPRKLLNDARMKKLGWRASISLKDGLAETYRWFLDHEADRRGH